MFTVLPVNIDIPWWWTLITITRYWRKDITNAMKISLLFIFVSLSSRSDWVTTFMKLTNISITFQKLPSWISLWFSEYIEVYFEGQRLVANVSFAGTMWEHKGRLETQYCACTQARDVSNGLHQKISSTFCEEASSCPKRIRVENRRRIDFTSGIKLREKEDVWLT